MRDRHKKVYIALGSNLRSFSHKNVKVFFNSVLFRLGLLGLKVKRKSGIWKSNPIPAGCGPNFFNSVIECSYMYDKTEDPHVLLNKISILEKKLGKKFKGKNKERVIDIDIIDFQGFITTNKINLPHPRMHLRKFVLMPLYEINKYWLHPSIKKNCIFLRSKIKGNQFLKKSEKYS